MHRLRIISLEANPAVFLDFENAARLKHIEHHFVKGGFDFFGHEIWYTDAPPKIVQSMVKKTVQGRRPNAKFNSFVWTSNAADHPDLTQMQLNELWSSPRLIIDVMLALFMQGLSQPSTVKILRKRNNKTEMKLKFTLL